MYDELIKSIHCCFGFEEPAVTDCENCMMKDKREEHNYVGCCDALGLAAADAIEELSAIREEQKAQIIAMAAEDKPRWISVTERLPEEDGCYLVAVKNDHQRKYSKTAWFSHDSWFARQDVTHWMPLPQPPKEEQ